MEEYRMLPKVSRSIIENHLKGKKRTGFEMPASFEKKVGLFITLKTYPENDLRGCIGLPEPVMSLKDGLLEASISSATRDPRFPPVKLNEMDNIVIEVTVLTPPEEIPYDTLDDLLSAIKIGRDGLIVKMSYHSGLLLPQVPVEWGWNVEEFLSHTCRKAGMPMDQWKKGDVTFYRFSGRVFAEEEPGGKVEEKPLA